MGDGGSSDCLSQAFGGLFPSLSLLRCFASWLTLGASLGPTPPSSPGPVGDFFISGLLVLPALVLVVSGLKRATCLCDPLEPLLFLY